MRVYSLVHGARVSEMAFVAEQRKGLEYYVSLLLSRTVENSAQLWVLVFKSPYNVSGMKVISPLHSGGGLA
jgi:hypothetical protein